MARTPTVTRDQVPEPLRAAFDAETANSGGVVATGPGSLMINSLEMRRRANHPTTPHPAALAQELSQLELDLQSLGFTVAAAHYRQAYESFAVGHWEAANGQIRLVPL